MVRYGGANACCSQSRANLYNYGGILDVSNTITASSSLYGIYNYSGTTTADGVDFRNQSTGIQIYTGVSSVLNSMFTSHSNYGIYTSSGSNKLTVASSTFSTNGNGVGYIDGSTDFYHWNNTASGTGKRAFIIPTAINADRTWQSDSIPYLINTLVTVNSGKTLSVGGGSVVKFDSTSSRLLVNGNLNINGSTSSPVYFTSVKDDAVGGDTNYDSTSTSPVAGDWREIEIASGATSTISSLFVRYGGSSAGTSRANIYNKGNLTITDSQIATSSLYGIRFESGSMNVSSSSINNNGTYGIYSTAAATTTAKYNYWGNSSGPYHPIYNPSGTGNRVSDKVDFSSWLTVWP